MNKYCREMETKTGFKIFEDFIKSKNIENPENKSDLCDLLISFYVERRQEKPPELSGKMLYSKRTMSAIRAALRRHFISTSGFDIVKDPEFIEANRQFQATRKKLWKSERSSMMPFLKEDYQKLYECGVFSLARPETLQNKVFFEVILYFIGRLRTGYGRAILHKLKKSDFIIATDTHGKKYIKPRSETHEFVTGLMVENGVKDCPVASFELHSKHLHPNNEYLFQKPKESLVESSTEVWYQNKPMSKGALANKMTIIAQEAKLSKPYNNHSIKYAFKYIIQNTPAVLCMRSTKKAKQLVPEVEPALENTNAELACTASGTLPANCEPIRGCSIVLTQQGVTVQTEEERATVIKEEPLSDME